ncbi:MAG TPA: 3'-5' exonuclease, partial [Parasegetibacter sp.]
ALKIAALLLENGLPTKLIQSNEGFSLNCLLEVRYFLDYVTKADNAPVIDENLFEEAKRSLRSKFRNSTKLELCERLINDFESTNSFAIYKSDLEIFIRESKIEDFWSPNGKTIFVSTIHKAKGKEFDNVFVLLENGLVNSDEEKRKIYVGITRAKNNLYVHTDSPVFDSVSAENLVREYDKNIHLPPDEIIIHPTHRDVYLDYFLSRQEAISRLISGDSLTVRGKECLDKTGFPVLRFSNAFSEKIQEMVRKGYKPKSAKVNYIVYWKREGADEEIKIILPELAFERAG